MKIGENGGKRFLAMSSMSSKNFVGFELEEQGLDLEQAFSPRTLPSFGLSSKSSKSQQRIRVGHGEVGASTIWMPTLSPASSDVDVNVSDLHVLQSRISGSKLAHPLGSSPQRSERVHINPCGTGEAPLLYLNPSATPWLREGVAECRPVRTSRDVRSGWSSRPRHRRVLYFPHRRLWINEYSCKRGAPAPAAVAAAAPATGRPGRPRAPTRVFSLAREDAEQAEHVTEGVVGDTPLEETVESDSERGE
ncbi:hypothetical protein Taro_025114 [Colocasia esculenta]|uniref:Uncharacterized protein n=1 Tax=Colocasia esculenta TaxID=4460 RepID=A0A843V823_COLES|nr:hypothetical protein [Colocasia esculenta]